MSEIAKLQAEIVALKATLQEKETQLHQLQNQQKPCPYTTALSTEEVVRYSRQMIMPAIQLSGQLLLKQARILIVGAGGLGCPSSLYLAAAGIGEIHIVDYDEIELSNLHRQILHYESDLGRSKVDSVAEKLKKINSNIKVVPLNLTADGSLVDYIAKNRFSAILDCTDNVPTRYLLNDLAVLHNIPLVSGSALQMEGQLTVYNYKSGPCYRCLFPTPPPAFSVTNCGDGGVLGPVPGLIGTLQAIETIKIVTKQSGVLSGRLLLFDASESSFRCVRLRGKAEKCAVCGEHATIRAPIDYEAFCGAAACDQVAQVALVRPEQHVEVELLENLVKGGGLVVDVRPELEFRMCRLPNCVNLPYLSIKSGVGLEVLEERRKSKEKVYLLCRRGNDSQRSLLELQDRFSKDSIDFYNIRGGLHAFARKIDSAFPIY